MESNASGVSRSSSEYQSIDEKTAGKSLYPQLNREEGLRQQDVINVLSNVYSDIFTVNVETGQMHSYRYSGQTLPLEEISDSDRSYETAMERYMEQMVVPEDQGK